MPVPLFQRAADQRESGQGHSWVCLPRPWPPSRNSREFIEGGHFVPSKMANPPIGRLREIPEKSPEDGHNLRRWPQFRLHRLAVPLVLPKTISPPPTLARRDLLSSLLRPPPTHVPERLCTHAISVIDSIYLLCRVF